MPQEPTKKECLKRGISERKTKTTLLDLAASLYDGDFNAMSALSPCAIGILGRLGLESGVAVRGVCR